MTHPYNPQISDSIMGSPPADSTLLDKESWEMICMSEQSQKREGEQNCLLMDIKSLMIKVNQVSNNKK
jgi:hypothetical protein